MWEIIGKGFLGIYPYLIIALVLLVVFRLVHDRLTPFDDKEELRRGNLAAGINRGAAYLGVVIAMCGSLVSTATSYAYDLGFFFIDGLIAIATFTIAAVVFDKVVLPSINNSEEIGRGNMAVAVTEGLAYVGLGFIMLGSFAGGNTDNIGQGIASSLLFSALGLSTLVLCYKLFVIGYRFKGCPVNDEIGRGNMAMGIEAGSTVLAISLVLGFSIIGEFNSWSSDIASYTVAAVAGVLAIAAAQVVTKLLFARGLTIGESGSHAANVASSAIQSSVLVGFGLIAGLVTFI